MLPSGEQDIQRLRQYAVRQGEGGHPGAGPLPRAGAGYGALLLGARRGAGAAVAGEHH